jgi:exopolysaccharide production protein ExoQ
MNLPVSHHDPYGDHQYPEIEHPLVPNWFTKLERGFAIVVVIYHTNVLYLPLSGRLSAEDPMMNRVMSLDASPLIALVKGLVLITLFFLISQRWRSLLQVFSRRKGLLVMIGWLILSCFWAPEFDRSFKLANELGVVTLTGLYLASRFSVREFLSLAAIGMGLVATINFLYCLAVPSVGIQIGVQAGAWRGLFIQKNVLARVLFFSGLVFLSLLSANDPLDRSKRPWVQGGLLICTLMIVLSQSKTGLVLLLGFMALVQVFKLLRSRNQIVLPLVFCLVLIGAMSFFVVTQNYETILTGLGRDVTLSGRTDIWGAMLEKILQRPWTGYGYAGFWQGKEGESVDIFYMARDMPPHGHNGYLDMAIDIGLLGLGFFLMDFFRSIVRSIHWLRQMPVVESIFPILYLVGVFIYNITEDSLVGDSTFNFIWLIYCYVTSAILFDQIPEPMELEFVDELNQEWEDQSFESIGQDYR